MASAACNVDACKTNPETQHMKLDEFRAWLMEGNEMYKELFKKMHWRELCWASW